MTDESTAPATRKSWEHEVRRFEKLIKTSALRTGLQTRAKIGYAIEAMLAIEPYDTSVVLLRSEGDRYTINVVVFNHALWNMMEVLRLASVAPVIASITHAPIPDRKTQEISIKFTPRPKA